MLSALLVFLVVIGLLIASAVVATVLILSRSNSQTQLDDAEFYMRDDSDNPYASSNVLPQRRRQNPWLLAGAAIVVIITFLCVLFAVAAFLLFPAPMPAPKPVITAPAEDGRTNEVNKEPSTIE